MFTNYCCCYLGGSVEAAGYVPLKHLPSAIHFIVQSLEPPRHLKLRLKECFLPSAPCQHLWDQTLLAGVPVPPSSGGSQPLRFLHASVTPKPKNFPECRLIRTVLTTICCLQPCPQQQGKGKASSLFFHSGREGRCALKAIWGFLEKIN